MSLAPEARFRLGWHHVLLALGLYVVLTTSLGVALHFTPIPLNDQWDGTIGFYLRAQQAPYDAWFEQHNEHRLIFSRLLFYLDVGYVRGRNVSLLAANLFLAALVAATMLRIATRHSALSRAQRIGLAGGIFALIFSWMQEENFTWGFQSQWFAVSLFALWAFESIQMSAQHVRARRSWRAWGWLLAALACAIGAACSMASGLLVVAIVAVLATHHQLGWTKIVVVIAGGIVVWSLYLRHWHPVAANGSGIGAVLQHPLGIVQFVLLYLGAPGMHTLLGRAGAFVWGLFVAGTTLVQVIRSLRLRGTKAIALLAFSGFILATALSTALGRLSFGPDSALASRYTTASLSCAPALVIYTWINARSIWVRRTATIASIAMLTVVAVFQHRALQANPDEAFARKVGGLALRAHVYDGNVTGPLYPFEDRLVPTAQAAEAARLSIFSPAQTDFYDAPPRISAGSRCEGHIDRVWQTRTPGVYGASGWIYDPASRRVPGDVVVVSPDGRTLGTGVSGGKRDDVATIHGNGSRHSAWTAFFTAPPQSVFEVAARVGNDVFCSTAGAAGRTP